MPAGFQGKEPTATTTGIFVSWRHARLPSPPWFWLARSVQRGWGLTALHPDRGATAFPAKATAAATHKACRWCAPCSCRSSSAAGAQPAAADAQRVPMMLAGAAGWGCWPVQAALAAPALMGGPAARPGVSAWVAHMRLVPCTVTCGYLREAFLFTEVHVCVLP